MPVDIRRSLKKFLPHMLQAQSANLNEADTVQRQLTPANQQKALIDEVYKAIESAIANGDTLAHFRKTVSDKLTTAWGREQLWRIETIFRTSLQTAYAAENQKRMTDPVILKYRPYWSFQAVRDSSTSPICSSLDETILPANHPFWKTHIPPLHRNCRSTLVSLTKEEAEKEGIDEKTPDVEAEAGFGGPPDLRRSFLISLLTETPL